MSVPLNEDETLPDDELASAIGVSIQVMRGYRRKLPLPFVGKTLRELREWRLKWVDTKRGRPSRGEVEAGLDRRIPTSQLDEEIARAELAERIERGRKLKMANDIKEGTVRDSDEVERQVAELTGLIRIRLESVARELEPELPAEVRSQVTELVANKMFLVLTEMSQWRLSE